MRDRPVHMQDDDCDSCTTYDSDASEFRYSASQDMQIERLTPARTLAAAGIDIIVWGRDALSIADNIAPDELHCHLLVEDKALFGSMHLLRLLGYCSTLLDPVWPKQEAYPDSIRLRHGSLKEGWMNPSPHLVLLTPMSYYHVDRSWCRNPLLTISLAQPEDNKMLRFPTWCAYLDSLITTYLEPRHGRNWRLEGSLRINIAALVWSKVRKKDRTGFGQMSEAEEEVLLSVSKENQPFVKRVLVVCIEGCWEQWRNERRRILTGEYEVRGCSCRRCAETERFL
ncbi:hypothetical protein Q9L58_006890 [Maublancomyces gigas]|uniref:Uncharacterized protein n=1 Tax=Discina gigas TaxID=1032678 RepID=A0ABR3GE80_9PEZI